MNILFFIATAISLKCGIMLFDIFAEDSLVALLFTLTFSALAFFCAYMLTSHKKGKTFSFVVFCILSLLFIFGENFLAVGELELMTFRPITLMYLVDIPFFVYFTFFGSKLIDMLKKRHVVISSVFIFVFFISFVIIWNVREPSNAETLFGNAAETVFAKNGYHKSDYFGSSDGNVVIIEVPSLNDAVLNTYVDGEPLLPNFKEFFDETLFFDNFYTETYDGSVDIQFAAINSLFPSLDNTVGNFYNNKFNSLANILLKNGYSTTSFSTAQSGLFNREAILNACGFEKVVTAKNDRQSLEAVALKASERRKSFQYVTLATSSAPYTAVNYIETSCSDVIDDMINSLVEADRLFGEFIGEMKKNGGYERTVVAVFGTATELTLHKRGALTSYEKFTEVKYNGVDSYRAPFGIRVPKIKGKSFSANTSVYDIFPTIMDILGITDEEMLIYGCSALHSGKEGNAYFVLGDVYRGSYVDGEHIYIKARNGNDQIFNSDMSFASLSSCLTRSKEVVRMVGECDLFYKKNIFMNMNAGTFSDIVEENERISLISAKEEDISISEYYRDELFLKGKMITLDKLVGVRYNLIVSDGALKVKNRLEDTKNKTTGEFHIEAQAVGNNSVSISPFGDGKLYCSFLIDGEYTEYVDIDSKYLDEALDVVYGKVTANDNKTIENVRVRVVLTDDDVFFGLNMVVGDELGDIMGSLEERAMLFESESVEITAENEYSFLLEVFERKLLGKATNRKIEGLFELVGEMKKNEILTFFDNYDITAIKKAISVGAVVTAIDKDGKMTLVFGYDKDGVYVLSSDGKIEKYDEKALEGRVMVAQNNDKELVIIEDFIPIDALIRPGYVNNDKKYIVIHNTGNYAKDSDAKLHALYLQNQAASATPREASWHYTVDDKVVYYHIPDNENAWHASDGNFGNGNYHGIGIEICVNGFPEVYSGAAYENWLIQFKATLDNAAKLTAHLMVKYDLDMNSIKQHYDFARDKKNCPMQMRYNSKTQTFERDTGDMWIYFLEKTEAEWNKLKNK